MRPRTLDGGKRAGGGDDAVGSAELREGDRDVAAGRWTSPTSQLAVVTGRWTSPDAAGLAAVDPTNPQSWNRYSYVLNNPLANVDPLGLHDDCGGPCSGFSYQENGCTVIVSYYVDDIGYDEPLISASCPAGGWGGTTQQSAPNSGPRPGCVQSVLLSNAVSVGIDAVGLIPEAGGVARFIGNQAGYRGVAADQRGAKVIRAFGKSTSTVNGLSSITDTSCLGLASTALTVTGFIPGLGQASAALSLGVDLFKTYKAVSACYSHP